MQRRPLPLVFAASTALLIAAGCGSPSQTSAQAPVQSAEDPSVAIDDRGTADDVTAGIMAEMVGGSAVDDFAPKPWTGAFAETAIMLTRSVRIEGPEGLLDHVVASSDDEFYERTIETTPEGLLQTVRRRGSTSPEIRVRLDRWTIAVEESVVLLETIAPGPVRLVASGNALWRDVDGHLAQAQRLEFTGEIGVDTPVRPDQTYVREQNDTEAATVSADDTGATEVEIVVEPAADSAADSAAESINEPAGVVAPEVAPSVPSDEPDQPENTPDAPSETPNAAGANEVSGTQGAAVSDDQ